MKHLKENKVNAENYKEWLSKNKTVGKLNGYIFQQNDTFDSITDLGDEMGYGMWYNESELSLILVGLEGEEKDRMFKYVLSCNPDTIKPDGENEHLIQYFVDSAGRDFMWNDEGVFMSVGFREMFVYGKVSPMVEI